MAVNPWFRRSAWSPSDRADFFARFARSRLGNRAQYLRIQAWHLQQVGTEPMYEAALDLLNMLVADYPEPTQLSEAHSQRAACLAATGRTEEAILEYRTALGGQREFPNVIGYAYIEFAELVLELDRRELFSEALAVLQEFSGYEFFPTNAYRMAAARAMLYDCLGQRQEAARFASLAIAAAAATESGFRYHRDLGLVDTDAESETLSHLRQLAQG
jgi:tetratricopeptide (TPR) repeat protein